MTAPFLLPLLGSWMVGCTAPDDPLVSLDARYTRTMIEIGVADRDTARNVHNQEARRRKAAADEARVAFFRDPTVSATIEQVRASPASDLQRAKADGYWRALITARPWTSEEKDQESKLVARIEENNAQEATWNSPDGTITVDLTESWLNASKGADALPPDQRADLAASYADRQLRVIGADLQEVVRLRNKVAQREGFDNYWQLSLASQGLDPKQVDAIIAELSEVVAPINASVHAAIDAEAKKQKIELSWANLPLLRRGAGLEASRDRADAWFDTDRAEERVMTAFQDMGIPTDGFQVYTGPSRYVRPGVYGFPIKPPENVAIVMSQDRRWSVWQYEALAHETGHAVWWKSITGEALQSPVLWEPPSPWFEGFAQFFERVVYEPAFTARYVPELPEADRQALADWRAAHLADWITDSLVDTMVERRLYEDPTSLEAVERFAADARAHLTGLPTPPADATGRVYDPSLTSSILWNYPAYAQNYLFAYVVESALFDAVSAQAGSPVGNPKVGPLLISRLVQAPPGQTFADALAALQPGDRVAALKKYIKDPTQVPEIKEVPVASP